MSLPTVVCKRCGESIAWVRTADQPGRPGRAMPVDPQPNEAGNVYVRYEAGKPIAHVASKVHPRPAGVPFMPHFATCSALDPKRKRPAPAKPKRVKAEPPPTLL